MEILGHAQHLKAYYNGKPQLLRLPMKLTSNAQKLFLKARLCSLYSKRSATTALLTLPCPQYLQASFPGFAAISDSLDICCTLLHVQTWMARDFPVCAAAMWWPPIAVIALQSEALSLKLVTKVCVCTFLHR